VSAAGVNALEELHACERAGEQPQFRHGGEVMDWAALCGDAATLHAELAAAPARDWALFHGQAYPFAVALLAALAAGKRVWIPANATAGSAARLTDFCDGWLGRDWQGGAPIPLASARAPALPGPLTGSVVIFTSGSSGEPQPIAKNLAQLSRETAGLERLWGERLGASEILASVSHQHIYGLLFRVLWPLAAGRVSHSERYAEVDALLGAAAECASAAWVTSPAHLKRLHAGLPWDAAGQALTAVFASGGPLAAESAQACARLCGQWPTEVYGSSETGGVATRTQAGHNAHWQPLPGVEVRAGADGALQLRSPHLADAGWWTMSDAVEVAHDGRFRLGDRLDRIVKVEGKRLALSELERAIGQHAWIGEARALLLQRRRESVAVVAVPSEAGAARLEALGRHAFSRHLRQALLADFDPVTLPRLWRFVDALPADAQGKVGHARLAGLFERSGRQRLP